jgi:hypothetical protein
MNLFMKGRGGGRRLYRLDEYSSVSCLSRGAKTWVFRLGVSPLQPGQKAKRKAVESLDNVTITSHLAKWEAESKQHREVKKPNKDGEMVGTGRFELPTPRTPSECSTRLSHVPTEENPPRPNWRGGWG